MDDKNHTGDFIIFVVVAIVISSMVSWVMRWFNENEKFIILIFDHIGKIGLVLTILGGFIYLGYKMYCDTREKIIFASKGLETLEDLINELQKEDQKLSVRLKEQSSRIDEQWRDITALKTGIANFKQFSRYEEIMEKRKKMKTELANQYDQVDTGKLDKMLSDKSDDLDFFDKE